MDVQTGQARLATTRAARYMEQMFKHFEHKLPVTRAEGRGTIQFNAGICTLTAESDALAMKVDASTPTDLATVEDVVARHLLRFAFREEQTEINWA